MNDFTKEELETLLGVLNIFYHSNNYINDELEGYLRIKLQSLIDNYECDHFGIIKLDDNFQPISNEECMFCHKPME